MSATPMKPFRVMFEERHARHVDVMAVAAWQALEIAQALNDSKSSAVRTDDVPPYHANWHAEPLEIGGGL